MKPKLVFKIVTLLLLCLSVNGQNTNNYKYNATPSFNNVSTSLPENLKLEQIRWKTQDFIANNINYDDLLNFLIPGEVIEFNVYFVISKKGIIKSVSVNTPIKKFNTTVEEILKKIPVFSPAMEFKSHNSIDYDFRFRPEFIVSKEKKLKPIYRRHLSKQTITIPRRVTDSIRLNEFDLEFKNKIEGSIYFSTNNNKDLINLIVFTNNKYYENFIENYFLKIRQNDSILYKNLIARQHYWAPLNLYLDSSSLHYKPQLSVNESMETVPVFPNCENEKNNNDKLLCMSSKIQKHIETNFDTNLANNLDLDGVQRIIVLFKINENGDIVNIKARAQHPKLENEAIRVVKLLPKIIPGTQNGKPVSIDYSLPIKFQVQKGDTEFEKPF